jgi:hypothetical protein
MNDFVKLVFDHNNELPDHWVCFGLVSQKYNPTERCTVVKEQDKELVLTITLYRELLKIHVYFVKECLRMSWRQRKRRPGHLSFSTTLTDRINRREQHITGKFCVFPDACCKTSLLRWAKCLCIMS